MAASSAFTPKASLTKAPTNLKEAIDWVLRVTGRDGKSLDEKNGECICGLAAAVTDLLQSVELEYNGYQGDTNGAEKNKGANAETVKGHLNGLFSLVQGLGGTAVVRTYIDQLAQVLSALVGWSRIKECSSGMCGGKPHSGGGTDCEYLEDVQKNTPCDKCGCMKWVVTHPDREGTPLGRRCTRCSGDKKECKCDIGGDASCSADQECQCAKAGKCCKCCCKEKCGNCKKECSCDKGSSHVSDEYNKDSYMSAYPSRTVFTRQSFIHSERIDAKTRWNNVTSSPNRHHCARILLGSVCLIWSGLTYMYWTGKWAETSPRWNNHILDGSGLDDGTLSQWLQALGFPQAMLNNHGPGNRLDEVINSDFVQKFFMGYADTSNNSGSHGQDKDDNTFRNPAGLNIGGFIHAINKGAFGKTSNVFPKNGSSSSSTGTVPDQNKIGAIFKLYILSCAYFTGLQKKTPPKADNRNPKTIREILYWLSALPYSQAYPEILKHGKSALEKVSPKDKKLSFHQEGRWAPITVDEFNLFAHFQAVTQYCPLVLIGIQGGLHSTDTTTPAIHSLYANTECHFTYPTVSIQAYNQVVHYIRALFYQLYFLRKQCAVKVTCGGKWRECRYGQGVVSKGVISWMCLGCNPMEHDRKCRVDKVKGELKIVPKGKDPKDLPGALKEVLEKIGEVVVQLGNAQEALEEKKTEGIKGVIRTLGAAKGAVDTARTELEAAVKKVGLEDKLKEAKDALNKLTSGGGGILEKLLNEGLGKAEKDGKEVDPGKNAVSAAIHDIRKVVDALKKGVEALKSKEVEDAKFAIGDIVGSGVADTELENILQQGLSHEYTTLLQAIKKLISICNTAKCSACKDHANKCGQQGEKKTCDKCHQQYMDGFPSPLQAFLEDRLPGFSCQEVVNDEKEDPNYPPAASHLGHCGGSGQCCPLPMGFRGHFHKGSISDMTGHHHHLDSL
ncbi:variant erythrocyte surface antigen-1 alpha subunit [Babesia bovis T2Bo]|uniref:Variant erythrocyte surface antigen-1, alpha subunit n=1 Tax=Babesia bovis TaxID=5865 RepID=A7AVY9_BABBO|nr:variant erythrocyte surface antigen-1 alpha subunit [Babesia bovis T2Bo]EDO05217.1 variant erythrocyte surface antigen-1 alpha subunit [Babesia bovis T2Bo]|eukprot:XP_001608785.1 variant erythrocyte surface antigen-1, alpha subunit [Babesia bovis T2Bo]